LVLPDEEDEDKLTTAGFSEGAVESLSIFSASTEFCRLDLSAASTIELPPLFALKTKFSTEVDQTPMPRAMVLPRSSGEELRRVKFCAESGLGKMS
jgi:hypothetical protein